MAHIPNPETDPSHPLVYQIRIKGHLAPDWSDWFEGLTTTVEANGETLLTGRSSIRRRSTECSAKCVISASSYSRSSAFKLSRR
jgi:hypothetical protein